MAQGERGDVGDFPVPEPCSKPFKDEPIGGRRIFSPNLPGDTPDTHRQPPRILYPETNRLWQAGYSRPGDYVTSGVKLTKCCASIAGGRGRCERLGEYARRLSEMLPFSSQAIPHNLSPNGFFCDQILTGQGASRWQYFFFVKVAKVFPSPDVGL
jgi:hypothetical protein